MQRWLANLQQVHRELCQLPPATADVLDQAESTVGRLPSPLRALLSISNGLYCRSFRLFSAFDETQPQKTWESLQRANDPAKSGALGGDAELHARFLVFADIGNGFALLDREDISVWYVEGTEPDIHNTVLDLREFIEVVLENVE
jgi:hypothetical protein